MRIILYPINKEYWNFEKWEEGQLKKQKVITFVQAEIILATINEYEHYTEKKSVCNRY